MNIEQLLADEIIEEIEALKNMEPGSEQYKATVDGIAKLSDKLHEMCKFEAELESQAIVREEENKFRDKQAKREHPSPVDHILFANGKKAHRMASSDQFVTV